MDIHALVPGGALSADGEWVAAKHGFLFPITALSTVFRGKFVAALKLARQGGNLQEAGLADQAWRDLLSAVYRHDWVVYAKQSLGGPEQVLDYLGRYTHRVAISNERILGVDEDSVRLRVRSDLWRGSCAMRIPPRWFPDLATGPVNGERLHDQHPSP